METQMNTHSVEQLTRDAVVKAATDFAWTKKMPKWTVIVDGKEFPAPPLVLAAAGVAPNDSTNSHMAVAKLKTLGFETRYLGQKGSPAGSDQLEQEFLKTGLDYYVSARWSARQGQMPVCGNLF